MHNGFRMNLWERGSPRYPNKGTATWRPRYTDVECLGAYKNQCAINLSPTLFKITRTRKKRPELIINLLLTRVPVISLRTHRLTVKLDSTQWWIHLQWAQKTNFGATKSELLAGFKKSEKITGESLVVQHAKTLLACFMSTGSEFSHILDLWIITWIISHWHNSKIQKSKFSEVKRSLNVAF